jgi:two-component system, NtrC family, sensor histidine kinase PilS
MTLPGALRDEEGGVLQLIDRLKGLIRADTSWVGPDFRGKVERAMLLRLIINTILLGATIVFQLGEAQKLLFDPAIPLYILIGAIFLISLIYTLSLPLISNLWLFSFVQVMIDVVYTTAVIHFTGGAHSVFTLLYVLPIISSGTLHLRRGALVTASASSILFCLLIHLQFHGIMPPSDWPLTNLWSSPSPTGSYYLWVTVIHLVIFFVVALLAGSIAEQLRTTRVSLDETKGQFKKLSELHGSIVRSISSGIITTDEKDRITFINSAGIKLLGERSGDVVHKPVCSVLPAIDPDLGITAAGRHSYVTVMNIRGEQLHLELYVSDLRGEDGTPNGRLVVFQDVTGIKKMEQRAKLSERQAAFVRIAAGMAHEIRNPLASLRGAAELLSMAPHDQIPEERLLRIVIRESDRLNSLLEDFLLTVNARRFKRERISLTDLVRETVELFAQGPRVGEEIKLDTLLSTGVEVEGDPDRLKQALWNLLTNAVESIREEGSIHVTLDSDVGKNQAVIRIRDSGSGIAPEIRNRLFEPFATTKETGSGLGLAMVLSIVESQGGTIETDSRNHKGTAFTIKLPLATQDPAYEEGTEQHA